MSRWNLFGRKAVTRSEPDGTHEAPRNVSASFPSPDPSSLASQIAVPPTPEVPLTSDMTRRVQFSTSEPKGYYFEQVETFVDQVIASLKAHEDTEYALRKAVYELQVELDRKSATENALRNEIEIFKVNGSPLVHADGSYVRESELSESAEVAALQSQIADMQHALAEAQANLAAKTQEVAELRAWGEQIIASTTELQNQLITEQQKNTGADVPAGDQALLERVLAAEAQNAQLQGALTQAQAQADTTGMDTMERRVVDAEAQVAQLREALSQAQAAQTQVQQAPAPESASEAEALMRRANHAEAQVAQLQGALAQSQEAIARSQSSASEAESLVQRVTAAEAHAIQLQEALAQAQSTASEVEALTQRVTAAEAHATQLQEALTQAQAAANEVGALTQRATAAEAQASQSREALTQAQTALTQTQSALAQAQSTASEVHSLVQRTTAAEAQVAQLQDALSRAQAPTVQAMSPAIPPATAPQPVAPVAPAVTAPLPSSLTDAVWMGAEELPPGAALPGTGEAALPSYAPAAPGMPLDTQGVPMEVWAPELAESGGIAPGGALPPVIQSATPVMPSQPQPQPSTVPPSAPAGAVTDAGWMGADELPPGATLPGTGEAALPSYAPAAPGMPLDTQGVPVEVWAPELA